MADVNLDNLLNGVVGKFWNYGNNQKDNYMPELTGTLVKVSIAQQHEYGKPEAKMYWPDGNPMIVLRLHIKDPQGEEWLWEIKPRSTMWYEDIQPACPGGSLNAVIGKLIKLTFMGLVQTTGKSVNRNKFDMKILGDGQWPAEGFDPKMPPTKAAAMGMQQQPQVPSPQQYSANAMVAGNQGMMQQQYAQQQMQTQMPPQLQQAMQQAQQAGASQQAAMIQQQFPGAVVTQPQAQPQVQPQPMAPQPQVPEMFDSDIPF